MGGMGAVYRAEQTSRAARSPSRSSGPAGVRPRSAGVSRTNQRPSAGCGTRASRRSSRRQRARPRGRDNAVLRHGAREWPPAHAVRTEAQPGRARTGSGAFAQVCDDCLLTSNRSLGLGSLQTRILRLEVPVDNALLVAWCADHRLGRIARAVSRNARLCLCCELRERRPFQRAPLAEERRIRAVGAGRGCRPRKICAMPRVPQPAEGSLIRARNAGRSAGRTPADRMTLRATVRLGLGLRGADTAPIPPMPSTPVIPVVFPAVKPMNGSARRGIRQAARRGASQELIGGVRARRSDSTGHGTVGVHRS